nr:hypothetical protein [Natronorubrum bangense]
MEAGYHEPIDAETAEMLVEPRLEERVVKTLLEDVVVGVGLEVVNHRGSLRPAHRVFAPDLEFEVLRSMRVVGVDDRHAVFARRWQQLLAERRNDVLGAVGGDLAGHEVV